MAAGRAPVADALRGEPPLIFVTVGTHEDPFQRLLDALAALPPSELVVQFGYGSPPPGVAHATRFMGFADMLENFRTADTVITHAGVGSILCARRVGHVPIVVPRMRRHGEHVDDHQAELTRALEERMAVVAVWDTDDLAETVASVRGAGPDSVPPLWNGRLARAVKEALHA